MDAPFHKSEYQKVIIDRGNISIILSISVSPFFEENIESRFYEVMLSEKWGYYVSFEKKEGTLLNKAKREKKSDKDILFIHDNEERELEDYVYGIEAFRGVLFNEFLHQYTN